LEEGDFCLNEREKKKRKTTYQVKEHVVFKLYKNGTAGLFVSIL